LLFEGGYSVDYLSSLSFFYFSAEKSETDLVHESIVHIERPPHRSGWHPIDSLSAVLIISRISRKKKSRNTLVTIIESSG